MLRVRDRGFDSFPVRESSSLSVSFFQIDAGIRRTQLAISFLLKQSSNEGAIDSLTRGCLLLVEAEKLTAGYFLRD